MSADLLGDWDYQEKQAKRDRGTQRVQYFFNFKNTRRFKNRNGTPDFASDLDRGSPRTAWSHPDTIQ